MVLGIRIVKSRGALAANGAEREDREWSETRGGTTVVLWDEPGSLYRSGLTYTSRSGEVRTVCVVMQSVFGEG